MIHEQNTEACDKITQGGLPVYGFTKAFGSFAQGSIVGIPNQVILTIILFIIFIYALAKTTLGRYLYGVGGNEEASRLSGIGVTKIKLMAYGLSGFLAGIAGLVLLSRTSSGQPSAGSGYEMDAIASVVIGGASMNGGSGSVVKTIVGAMLMGVLYNIMNLMGVASYPQMVLKGIVIVLAVLLYKTK